MALRARHNSGKFQNLQDSKSCAETTGKVSGLFA